MKNVIVVIAIIAIIAVIVLVNVFLAGITPRYQPGVMLTGDELVEELQARGVITHE